MTVTEITLIAIVILVSTTYLIIKVKSGKRLPDIIKDAKKDIIKVRQSFQEAKNLLSDDLVQKTLRKLIIDVEQQNSKEKALGAVGLTGRQKKLNVIEAFRSWLIQVLGSTQKVEDLINEHQNYISELIDDFIDFTHKMSGR
jgi:hypothetical protein